ncbi:MAG: excinuclease ABC subunit C [Bacteroidetes bacterium]|nr:excinuclease ABC subunit C [Bacteroidota bacterium]MBX7239093.1 excinuclease ABC subunit UvrC [Bacteroidia bacterium]MCC7514856.1 excinuclease ABC subunit C [Bacteroidia bacterium]MCW5919579.1 excinuclease ABC subunit UvrC [Bacteroidota bacterium]HMU76757.1 excinuclease ABC subunit UvrC [Bacteroidia bacterium]
MAVKNEHIKAILEGLPNEPGVYQFFDKNEKIIYVGKAKNLKKRVYSYFSKDIFESGKTAIMVRQISDLRFIITETELDALLLENNLIKKHQPRYNILLKDDKTYPWICIKNEPFPRIFYTRRKIRDGSQYFGPYASVKMINILLDMIHRLYKLRNCNLNLTPENIQNKKFRVCLEFHVGNCLGPCEGRQSAEDYQQGIDNIRHILKGNINQVIRILQDEMQTASQNLEFEKAQQIKSKLDTLEQFRSKSVIVSPVINNVDVVTIVSDENYGFANYMKVINGAILQSQTIELKKKLSETDTDLITFALTELRQRFESDATEILVNVMPDTYPADVEVSVPKIGEKKHLLSLSEKNARYYQLEKLAQYDKLNPEHKTDRLMEKMKADLRMMEQPRRIECFDNSNFQGTNAVAAMSVFINGKAAKKEYRHFNIKTVEGPDDFASMQEVIYRRYKRVLEEKQPLPQLIIIDGGKGQLNAALTGLEKLGLNKKIQTIGIAKKLEEIYYPGDSVPMYLDKKSETLKIIQQLRDEVHRFGITHHRNKRSRNFLQSEILQIPGIGNATFEKLIIQFKSVKKIKEATAAQIADVIGKQKAAIVVNYFNSEKQQADEVN